MTIPQAFQNALLHHQAGRLAEAEAAYRQILAAAPRRADALHMLGLIAHQTGHHEAAVEMIGRAIAVTPQSAACYADLSEILRVLGRVDEAVAAGRTATRLDAGSGAAHFNLANALSDMGRLDEAIAAYRRAMELLPDYAEAPYNLGNVLKDQGLLDEAVAAYQRAIQLQPNSSKPYTNLGGLLHLQGELDQAVAACRRALELKPDSVEALINLGVALKDQGKLEEAIACGRRALEIEPDSAKAGSNLIHTQIFRPACDAQTLDEEHRRWNQQHGAPLEKEIQPHPNDRSPDRRLRIGYVSPDFFAHAVSCFLSPLFGAHDHERFEIHAYSSVRKPDRGTEQLRRSVDHWHDVAALSDAALAAKVRSDRMDLLVDLSMHTAGHRLLVFARKPAPIQISWLAYPGRTGLQAIDYRLTDPFLDPAEEKASGPSEEPLRLPESWICFQPHDAFPEPAGLPAHRLGAVTFGSLNNFCKINARVLDLWARILIATKASRLLLVAKRGSHRSWVRTFLEARGVSGDRVEILDHAPTETYLHYYDRIDIALDPFPCNGVTTSCDALWMGAPVVTLIGPMTAGRAGWSLLSNIGLTECAARTEEEYLRVATELAGDLPRLAAIRQGLRDRMKQSPLMNPVGFARNVEAAYRKVWQRWCAEARAEPYA